MIFNSISFLVFFVLFFILYWLVLNKSLKQQNLLILIGSYVFYAWSDWRFLSYLVGASALNYYLGILIEKTTNQRYKRLILCFGLLQGIGGLAFFKYFNFFITSFKNAVLLLGINLNLHTLNIIIPLGISFFTFRILSYLFDINKGKIRPTTDWIVFFTYVSFFPSLLSGPIDRARAFIPQLEKRRIFDYNQATDGLRQILWGLFKKVVIADNCATYSNQIFDNYQTFPASSLLLGAFLYTIVIYADFSGYSDIAIGISRLIGFNISKNFEFPFFAQNIAEYWRKWHISLTSWLTEYIFTPLSISFRDYGKLGLLLAIIINFTICGLWHGANWTYVLFGFLHGCYFIPLILRNNLNKRRKIGKGKLYPSLKEFVNMMRTFILVMVTLIIFRSNTIGQAYEYIINLFSWSLISKPDLPRKMLFFIFIAFIMLFVEWLQREKEHGLQIDNIKYPILRWPIYYTIIMTILLFEARNVTFIYQQF